LRFVKYMTVQVDLPAVRIELDDLDLIYRFAISASGRMTGYKENRPPESTSIRFVVRVQ